jgi:hypothetical protein
MTRRAGCAGLSRWAGSGLAAAVFGLAACSGSPASSPAASAGASTGPSGARPSGDGRTAQTRVTASPGAFTVAGINPVPPNGSQDTAAQAAGEACDRRQMADDQRLGGSIATGFSVAGLPASADLLRHFLTGSGTAVSYPAGSRVAKLAEASAAFAAVNREVQGAVGRQLRAGGTSVRLSAGQLPLVPFDAAGGDLYWGFRGTQGLTVTGRGQREGSAFVGTLTYVIADSYGFPSGDTLGGFGAPMRYLQTVCGAPGHPGGAHWFPDTITVAVAFHLPA